jgi:hypothetical protein
MPLLRLMSLLRLMHGLPGMARVGVSSSLLAVISVIAAILFGCNRLTTVVQRRKSSSYGSSLAELVSTGKLLQERDGYVQ